MIKTSKNKNEFNFKFKISITKQLKIQNAIRENEILIKLDELDKKRIRAIAEPSLKNENTTWLEFYNSQITELRKELSEITK